MKLSPKDAYSQTLAKQLDPNIFLWITATVADATAVDPNGIKTLLANGLSTFLIKRQSSF